MYRGYDQNGNYITGEAVTIKIPNTQVGTSWESFCEMLPSYFYNHFIHFKGGIQNNWEQQSMIWQKIHINGHTISKISKWMKVVHNVLYNSLHFFAELFICQL